MEILLVQFIVGLIIFAILCWIVSKAPIPQPFSFVAYAILGLVAIVLLLRLFNIF